MVMDAIYRSRSTEAMERKVKLLIAIGLLAATMSTALAQTDAIQSQVGAVSVPHGTIPRRTFVTLLTAIAQSVFVRDLRIVSVLGVGIWLYVTYPH
jgi:hypothetical protein